MIWSDPWRFIGFRGLLAAVLCGCIVAKASANDVPRLIVSGVSADIEACGDSAIIAEAREVGVIWINYLTGQQIDLVAALPNQRDAFVMPVLSCSRDGRWVIAHYLRFEEGGDPTCETLGKNLPFVVLWDTRDKRHRVIGRGYFSFSVSPDGATLIYYRRMICGFDKDSRVSIDNSALKPAFAVISGDKIARYVRPARSGLSLGVGAAGWVAPDRFVVHLAEKEGDQELDPGYGAIAAVSGAATSKPSIVQLSPDGFRSSRALVAPRLSKSESDDLLHLAHCEVTGGLNQSLTCDDGRTLRGARGDVDIDAYCKDGRPSEFCTATSAPSWIKYRIGSRALLARRAEGANEWGWDIFLVDGQ